MFAIARKGGILLSRVGWYGDQRERWNFLFSHLSLTESLLSAAGSVE